MTRPLRQFAFSASVLTMAFASLSLFPSAAGAQDQIESAFAKRMMTLDRNKDGFLTADELPKSVMRQLTDADANRDGKWSPAELSSVSTASKESQAATTQDNPTSRRRGRAGNGAGGRGPSRPNTGPGSPLDAAQILKFALTFDTNNDGSLNPDELKRYASALAGRRARARQQREAEGGSTKASTEQNASTIPRAEERDAGSQPEEATGLKSKSNARNSDPFGNGSDK